MGLHAIAFARAMAHQQAGEFDEAEKVYEQILHSDPQHAPAWHHLGLVHFHQKQYDRATECCGRAVSLDGSDPVYQFDLGRALAAQLRFDEAVDSFQQSIQTAPDNPQPHYHLGTVLQQRGDMIGAKLRFQQAVRLHPEFAAAWNDLGIAHQDAGEFAEAGESFERLVRLVPGMGGAHFNLGNVRLAQGRLLDAVACYARAIERQPRFAEALNNLGTALHRLGRPEQALHAYASALKLYPEFSSARNNLGTLLSVLGRAAEAEACYREALAIDPDSVAAMNNLACALQTQLRLDEAEPLLRHALALAPFAEDVSGNLANVLALLGRVDEAADLYRRALEIKQNPRLQIHAATMLPPIYESTGDLHRRRADFERRLDALVNGPTRLDPAREAVPVNFLLAYQGFNDRELQRKVAVLYRPAEARGRETASPPSELPPPHFAVERIATGKIRVGFLSRFLRDHTIGDLTRGLISKLSRADFEVSVFLIGEAADETVNGLRKSAARFVNLPEDVAAAREQVATAGLDVLVFPDVGMDPVGTALAHSRLARVQCALWGHPVTTGIPTIDHFVSSRLVEPPDAAAHYTENLVLLDSLPVYYERPAKIVAASREAARREFGLPAGQHLYLCPQSLFKMHPDFDDLLRGILERDPAARIVLIEAPHRNWNETLFARLRRNLGALADNVIFTRRVDRQAFLRLIATADVVLDPLHFGGGNTSFQALGLGIPIVTLPSQLMRGRVTAGCYRKMKFETCVARSADEYVDLAVRLGTNPVFNVSVRAEIAARSPALFEDIAAIRELERFFRHVARPVRLDPVRPSQPVAA
ncbi:MAG: tetratricopeptide repeat protein [Planctomycetia bacterium]|nr:tetratricopeptide repeat protein [Planctomycetia bacterium]